MARGEVAWVRPGRGRWLAVAARGAGAVLVALATAGGPAACAAPKPAEAPAAPAEACIAGDAAACERAILAAPAPELLAKLLAGYDAALGVAGAASAAPTTGGWASLAGWLTRTSAPAALVTVEGSAPPERPTEPPRFLLARAALRDGAPTTELLLAVTRAGQPQTIVWLSGRGASPEALHLFPHDPLAPQLLGLRGIARGDGRPGSLRAELALAAQISAAVDAARRFDYVTAARIADELRTALRAIPVATELTARARQLLALLDAAAIGLEPSEPAAENAPADSSAAATLPTGEPSSAQAAYLRVALAGEGYDAAWRTHRAQVARELSADRLAVLDQIYRPPSACPVRVVPPMQRPGDLLFGARLGTVLDASLPGRKSKRDDGPALPVTDWLARYDSMSRLVEESGTVWSFLPALLNERGELWGLSASGTATYLHVTDLALRHLRALRALADSAPGRFRPLGLLSLFQLRGLATDTRVRQELGALTSHVVSVALEQAADEEALYDAATVAGMMAMSLPPDLQASHVTAIRKALGARLDTGVRAEPWGLAGLHGLRGLIGLLTGDPAELRAAAGRSADALSGRRVEPYPSLAPLVAAAARYVALAGTEALDPATSNPGMFGERRQSAASALRAALGALTEAGPESPQERDLLGTLAEAADGLIAVVTQAVAGTAPSPSERAAACASDQRLVDRADLREPISRLERKVRTLVSRPAFRNGDSPWLRRARLVVLVLSDAVDLLARRSDEVRFRLPEQEAARIVDQGLAGWTDGHWTDVAAGGYLLGRGVLDASGDRARLGASIARLLRGLGVAFAPADGAAGPSIFEALATISVGSATEGGGELSRMFLEAAGRCYEKEAAAQGDLLLFVALGLAIAREEPVADAVVTLATERRRPVALPLLAQVLRMKPERDPEPLLQAMRELPKEHCFAPDPEPIIALRRAAYDYRAGRRDAAISALEAFLKQAAERGLVVPRVVYGYEEAAGHKVLRLDGSLSWGSDWLKNSGTLQAGIGLQTSTGAGGKLTVRFAEKGGAAALEEAARVYAHASAQLAVYQYLAGNHERGLDAAQRSIAAWVVGVRLGEEGVAAADRTASWAADGLPVIAVAAELAAEAGHIFVAGDLWSLARAALGAEASDDDVAAALDPLPPGLDGVPELVPVIARARDSLRVVAAALPCTEREVETASLGQRDCAGYPIALAYRVSDGLTALPRLTRGAEVGRPDCAPLRALDDFLVSADARRYDPDAFTKAVTELERGGRPVDAAFLLARQRHPEHCSPLLVESARRLAARVELGPSLRSDLLSIAANCSAGRVDAALVADLRKLDEITQQLPVAVRNLQVVLFSVRLGLELGRWDPLLAVTGGPDFVARWLRFGPEAGTVALLVQHAALASAGRPIDLEATGAAYQLLCTTYPPAERAPLCRSIALLRAGDAAQDRKVIARDGLTTVLTRLTGSGSPGPAPSPTP